MLILHKYEVAWKMLKAHASSEDVLLWVLWFLCKGLPVLWSQRPFVIVVFCVVFFSCEANTIGQEHLVTKCFFSENHTLRRVTVQPLPLRGRSKEQYFCPEV